MTLGLFLIIILWFVVYDCDLFIGICLLVILVIWGGDVDDMTIEALETPKQTEQVIKADQPIQTDVITKDTCEASGGVWVPDNKACY